MLNEITNISFRVEHLPLEVIIVEAGLKLLASKAF